jgi:hypothetical protein
VPPPLPPRPPVELVPPLPLAPPVAPISPVPLELNEHPTMETAKATVAITIRAMMTYPLCAPEARSVGCPERGYSAQGRPALEPISGSRRTREGREAKHAPRRGVLSSRVVMHATPMGKASLSIGGPHAVHVPGKEMRWRSLEHENRLISLGGAEDHEFGWCPGAAAELRRRPEPLGKARTNQDPSPAAHR